MATLTQLKRQTMEFVDQGELATARPLWNQICEQEPLDVDNWLILSAIDEQLGFIDAALDHLKYPLHLTDQDQDVWQVAARLHWKKRHFEQALEHLHRALALQFDERELRFQAAKWLAMFGSYKQALVHYRFCVAYFADDLSLEEVSAACSCALLSKDTGLAIQWGRHVDSQDYEPFAERIVFDLADVTNPQWLAASLFDGQAAWLNAVAQKLNAQNKALTRHYYTTAAAARSAQRPELEQLLSDALSSHITTFLQHESSPEVCSCIEIGAASGGLGQQLRAADKRLALTGLCFSAEEYTVVADSNHYDVVLDEDAWRSYRSNLLAGCDLLIINQQTSDWVDLYQWLDALLADVSSDKLPPTLLVIGEDDYDAVYQHCLSCFQVSLARLDNDLGEFAIAAINADPQMFTGQSQAPKSGFEQLEYDANRLIEAEQSLGSGQYEKLGEIAKQLARTYPESQPVAYLQAIDAQHRQDYSRALGLLRKALKGNRQDGRIWFQLGTVWQALQRPSVMLFAYQKCLKYSPGHAPALGNLIAFYSAQRDCDEQLLSLVQQRLATTPLDENALQSAKQIIAVKGNNALDKRLQDWLQSSAFISIQFDASIKQQYFQRAEKLLERLKPLVSETELLGKRVNLLEKSGQISEAIALVKTLINQQPENTDHVKHLRSLHLAGGDLSTACKLWCDNFDQLDARDPDLQNGLFSSNYFTQLTDQQIAGFHFRWADRLTQALANDIAGVELGGGLGAESRVGPEKLANPGKRLRVGFVSGDFKTHSVAMFLYNIYKHRNRQKIELFSYATNVSFDNLAIKFRFFSDCWRDISKMNDMDAADRIRRDKIDILIDLTGHTAFSRLQLFALKPAPIQCTYLGYANTTGLLQMDYRFTDEIADPEGTADELHSEQLIRLPGGFLSYSRHFGSPAITLLDKNFDKQKFTFVCCNNALKMNEEVLDTFAQILVRLPGASLLIKSHNLNNDDIINRFMQRFLQNGIEQDRVHLMNALDMGDHQGIYNQTLIALDPFPYNGTTTSCDALWMGVPVLALRGSRHAACVGASLLTTLGLEDWVADTREAYIDKAVAFAQNTTLLNQLRLSLRHTMLNSTLMQQEYTYKAMEAAWFDMYGVYQQN